ncbi:magnesium and cobalt transport protein CorA [Isoptericola halotolerans]|uniref:Magnesium transport protein CorA n=1 Tax=Isoptericola halotolerans TaxID=300560 RepID=A0ABX2A236_9MICO|nr:magnesium/cobalt transporter CorA [Isoptericola halotolerans]NOV96744.1 magnesium transporter [Isoptericola halotolerans]
MAFSSPRSARPRQVLGALRPRRGAPAATPEPATPTPIRPRSRSAIVAAAVYDGDGHRTASFTRLADTFRTLRSTPNGMAWIGLERPDERELAALAREFDLHPLAIEDAIQAHQRPKIERYGDTLFVVLHAARYLDSIEEVEFSELHLFVGPDFVVSVRHGDSPDLATVRARLESTPQMLSRGPEAVLYAIMDRVVDDYAPVISGLDFDIDQIESEVFSGDKSVSRRIYELSREVVDFQRAVRPLQNVCQSLAKGAEKYHVDDELQAYLRDVADHLIEVAESVETFRVVLRDILTVNATLVAQRQNEEMTHLTEVSIKQGDEVKKISGWAAIIFAPSLVGSVYGMNFDVMPELHAQWGYPLALLAMITVSVGLFAVFRWKKWM